MQKYEKKLIQQLFGEKGWKVLGFVFKLKNEKLKIEILLECLIVLLRDVVLARHSEQAPAALTLYNVNA